MRENLKEGKMDMTTLKALLLGALGFMFFIPPVMGLIPPYSDKMLENEADAVVEAHVLGVVKAEEWIEKKWHYERYHAWLYVTKDYKGKLKTPTTLEVTWKEKEWTAPEENHPLVEDDEAHYYPGEKVKAYLKYSETLRAYRTVHWNGKEKLELAKDEKPITERAEIRLECK